MRKEKDILLVLVPGFILTVLWVAFSIYHNRVTSTITEPLTTQLIDIPGNFDLDTIKKLKERDRTEPIYTIEFVGETSPTPTPTPETENSTIPEEPVSTDSGALSQ